MKKTELFFEVHYPFDPEELDLGNLFTGLTAKTDDRINCDQTEEIGNLMEHHSVTHELSKNNKLSH